uniref:Uncharacterized protein n=1 Tax=Percolomonas cosmopolitus TaxID=63605 RepID=A0A7S1PHZ6_9EUKA|mmetsp:Transcript_6674/g.24973  ORF Transcript_6674/g.24973 Transcript_6674/m.24973 type:complete len:362 (+) Transcript_6674:244-1329(+)|eukprot:CAMPEP_0117444608 /NCGR_PEP_ID=MMETSP0759-20121206/5331_1 /TAXON_ID=63605 /ORGANISM="Percolomonas cosmopolitus, Strain WS" /LENGTH=361 /DNA_ID=CAMNT_0005236685 /DNA_START=206 /DNA_END=1291 /DNA_ORIENTATION=+
MPAYDSHNNTPDYVDMSQIVYPSTDDFVYASTGHESGVNDRSIHMGGNSHNSSPFQGMYPSQPSMSQYSTNGDQENQQFPNANYRAAPPQYNQLYHNPNIPQQQVPPSYHPPAAYNNSPQQLQNGFVVPVPVQQHAAPSNMYYGDMPPPPQAAFVAQYAAPPPVNMVQQQLSPEQQAKRRYKRKRRALRERLSQSKVANGIGIIVLCIFVLVCVFLSVAYFLLSLLAKGRWWEITLSQVMTAVRVLAILVTIMLGMVVLLTRNPRVNYFFSKCYCASMGGMVVCFFGTWIIAVIAACFATSIGYAIIVLLFGGCVTCFCVPICVGYGACGVMQCDRSRNVHEFEKLHEEETEIAAAEAAGG